MSQENSTSENTQDTRKKLLLGGLLVVLVGVVYYQFFSGSAAPSPEPGVASASAVTKPSPTPPRQTTPRTNGTPEPIVSQPLDLASMVGRETSSGGSGRNIFVYPTPPPPTPVPPPPPTPAPTPFPIDLFSVNPSGVIARTGDFTMTAFGGKIPQDAQGFVDGRAYPTTFVSATEIKVKVPGDAIRSPGNLSVMIRSQSNARIYSNSYSLNVAAPPEPPYKYTGLIISKNGVATAVLKSTNDDEVHNVKKDEKLGTRWKVLNITPQKIEIQDTQIKISHFINYSGES